MADLTDDDQQSDTSYTSTSICHDLSQDYSDKVFSFDNGMHIDDSKDLITFDMRDYTDVEESIYDLFDLQYSDTSCENINHCSKVLKEFRVSVYFINCKN